MGGELGGLFHKGTRKGSGILDRGGLSKKQGPWTVGKYLHLRKVPGQYSIWPRNNKYTVWDQLQPGLADRGPDEAAHHQSRVKKEGVGDCLWY